jgi:catalase
MPANGARREWRPAVTVGGATNNDPLLQGRNFSYLDTQLNRLGSPNFTHLAISASAAG